VGPLFGAVLVRAIDAWWDEQGRPDPWFVVDAGAGSGTLARAVLAAEPACRAALRYVLVERSAAQRARHADHLPLEPASTAFGELPSEEEEPVVSGLGPIAVSLAELPEVPLQGVIVANELLDNLPFALAELGHAGWQEVWVTAGASGFEELLVPARPAVSDVAESVARGAAVGARLPVQLAACRWLAEAVDRLVSGHVVVIDYAATSADLVGRPQRTWLRTYRRHDRGDDPLESPGGQDITVEVAVDQLARVRPPAAQCVQAAFLADHGLDELVDEGRRIWAERAAVGDLAAFRARSRLREAEALADPSGLGAFTVLDWQLP
jgi:SAM-dependent MidA family methyltransferase